MRSTGKPSALKILLTHTPQSRAQYYGARSLDGLQAIAQVKLHESNDALDAAGLIEAARDVDIIVADRLTAGPGEIFPALPNLRAFVRCAVDIRNIDVDAASAAGVLVTRAGPGFVQSVAELALGFMVDLSRGVSRATADYHAERKPEIIMGRQLAGSRLGIIGYGSIGRYLAEIAKVLGMEVLVADPFATVSEQGLQHVPLDDLLVRSDYVVCLAVANEQTENLIGQAALARMQRMPSSSTCRAAISSTRRRCQRRCARTASPAPRWMSAARWTRCRRRSWRSCRTSSRPRISAD